jgi:hypothetical protein
MNRIREQRPSYALVVACAALIALTAWSPTAAFGTTGEITRADASPDWLHGSIAGYVTDLPPSRYPETGAEIWDALAFVQPASYACNSFNPYYRNYPDGADKSVKLAWRGTTSFDIEDFQLDGSYGKRVCLYEHHEYLNLPDGGGYYVLLADRLLTVPQPPLLPPTQGQPVVTLSRATAFSKAKSALKRRFGKAYKRGKRKRLSCAKQSSTRYRCSFSFRYRRERPAGTVAVAIKPNGVVVTKIKTR